MRRVLLSLVLLAACNKSGSAIAEDAGPPRPIAIESAEGARIAADVDRVVDACPIEADRGAAEIQPKAKVAKQSLADAIDEGMCAERTKWVKAATGYETNVLRVLERSGATPRDDVARALAAMVLLQALRDDRCPDLLVPRILNVARARKPSRTAGLDVLLARVVLQIDLERLGLADAMRELATKWPGTPFQSIFVEELRVARPASVARVELLATMTEATDVAVQRSAIVGLAREAATLPKETCAAMARGRKSTTPANVLYAELRLAAAPCGKERDDALTAIETKSKSTPLPGIPTEHEGLLVYLCAKDLPAAQAKRSIASLHGIALSGAQPIEVRREAMDATRLCVGGDWKTLRGKLLLDTDPKVRAAVKQTDAMIIDW